ncbi:hypothetical protein, partial [Streptomyces sp. S5]|uniref:hypothetical protein n=1 Tax=Streptomyces sp. S5 TaxID=1456735 RepID=UPI001969D42D
MPHTLRSPELPDGITAELTVFDHAFAAKDELQVAGVASGPQDFFRAGVFEEKLGDSPSTRPLRDPEPHPG